MEHINDVLKEYDYSGDSLLYTEYDNNGNPTNIGEWDFRPMNSNRPHPDAPYLLVGRILPWSDSNIGLTPPTPNEGQRRVKDEDGFIVESETTGGRASGDWLVDGLTNFEQLGITINQYVAKLDESGEEVDNTFTLHRISPHKVVLQDSLFFDELGGEQYEIYHTDVERTYNNASDIILRFAIHNRHSEPATLSAHAMRHYFETFEAKDDMINVELEERDKGENPAWAQVGEVGDITDASRLLDEDEVSEGIQHRHEMQINLRVAEILYRKDAALEGDLNITVQQPTT